MPGLIAVIMMLIAALLTSLTVAREWETGTMEQLISTPVRGPELILGKLAPYFAIGMLDMVLWRCWQGVSSSRCPCAAACCCWPPCRPIYLVGALSLGILISILAKSQLLASQMAFMATFLPAFLLSGFMFDIGNMPRVLQLVTYLVPARYFVTILRGIYLKGVGLAVLWPECLLLTVFGALMLALLGPRLQETAGVTMLERLKHMLIKEFIQIFRDPRMRAVIFLVPIIQVIIFGYAVTTDVRHIPMALYDLDNTPASRELVVPVRRLRLLRHRPAGPRPMSKLQEVHRFRPGQGGAPPQPGLQRSHHRRAHGQRPAPPGRHGLQHHQHRPGLHGDGSRPPTTAASCWNAVARRPPGRALRGGARDLASRAWFNPNLESRNFFVPGVIALLVMMISIILSSMAIVREREIGTMEQIMVTPIGRLEFILGKTIPFALIGFVDVVLVSAHRGVLVPGAPVGAPPHPVLRHGPLSCMSTLGVGLFISTVSQTQQQAMMTAFFFMHAGHPALRLHLPHRQHARSRSSGSPTSIPCATSW